MSLYLIKLTNDDEIIGHVDHNDAKGLGKPSPLGVDRPLYVTRVSDEYGDSISLSRYLPYSKKSTVHIEWSSIICLTDLSPEMERYYDLSIKYCEQSLDKEYEDNLKSAIRYLEKTVDKSDVRRKIEAMTGESDEMIEKVILMSMKTGSDSIN